MHAFFSFILKLIFKGGKAQKLFKVLTATKGAKQAGKLLKLIKTPNGLKQAIKTLSIKEIRQLENLMSNFSTRFIRMSVRDMLKKRRSAKALISKLQAHDMSNLMKSLAKLELRDKLEVHKNLDDYLIQKSTLTNAESELLKELKQKLPKKMQQRKQTKTKTGLEFAALHSSWLNGAIYNYATGETLLETFSKTGKSYSFFVRFSEYEWYAFKAMRGRITNGSGSWLWHNQPNWMLKRRKTFRVVISPYTKRLMTLEKNKYGESMDEYLHKLDPETWIKNNFSNLL